MELLVRNAEGNLSERDREYAAKKLGRLDRYFNSASKVEMVHREEKLSHSIGHRVEITVYADGLFIRGEEHDTSLRAAIDKVAEKMEARLRKVKGRLLDRHRRKGHQPPPSLVEEPHSEDGRELHIAERKVFQLKPMTAEEAALQMELVDHPFFVFQNQDGAIEVIYRRRDGTFGLLQPKV